MSPGMGWARKSGNCGKLLTSGGGQYNGRVSVCRYIRGRADVLCCSRNMLERRVIAIATVT